jgi:hypothetical protein
VSPHPTYTMCSRVKKRLERRHGVLRCHRCGLSIRVGQDVTSISRSRRIAQASYRIYHEPCLEATYY